MATQESDCHARSDNKPNNIARSEYDYKDYEEDTKHISARARNRTFEAE